MKIYINGVLASEKDQAILQQRISNGKESIAEVGMTRKNNIYIRTV